MEGVIEVTKPRTVSTKIPQEWIELLEKYVIGSTREYSNISEYLRDLIRGDMKKRGLFRKEEQ